MKQTIKCPSAEFIQSISHIFHPLEAGSFFINHCCFLVVNQIITPTKMYILIDYEDVSIKNITPFRLEDVVIFDNFIMINGYDLMDNEELGRMAYLDKPGCAFKLLDFGKMKEILNEMVDKIIPLKAE